MKVELIPETTTPVGDRFVRFTVRLIGFPDGIRKVKLEVLGPASGLWGGVIIEGSDESYVNINVVNGYGEVTVRVFIFSVGTYYRAIDVLSGMESEHVYVDPIKPVRISFTVKDTYGNNIKYSWVEVYRDGNLVWKEYSQDGYFWLVVYAGGVENPLEPGTYTLRVYAYGYEVKEKVVTVDRGENDIGTITLAKRGYTYNPNVKISFWDENFEKPIDAVAYGDKYIIDITVLDRVPKKGDTFEIFARYYYPTFVTDWISWFTDEFTSVDNIVYAAYTCLTSWDWKKYGIRGIQFKVVHKYGEAVSPVLYVGYKTRIRLNVPSTAGIGELVGEGYLEYYDGTSWKPLPNQSVEVMGSVKDPITDSNGRFTFRLVFGEAGTYTITAKYAGR